MELTQSMKLIGIGDNGQESLLPQYAQWIEESEVLVGGERLLSFLSELSRREDRYKRWLTSACGTTTEGNTPTVVLASGDPLFFGIGGYLV